MLREIRIILVLAVASVLQPQPVAANCPSCPIFFEETCLMFGLRNQTSGICTYETRKYGRNPWAFDMECHYYLTGELERTVPPNIPFCLPSVNLTQNACKFYSIGNSQG